MDRALKRGAPAESLLTVKRELISRPVTESIKESGGKKDPDKYDSILVRAVLIITEMCRSLSKYGRETWADEWGEAIMKFMDLCAERVAGKTLAQHKNHQLVR